MREINTGFETSHRQKAFRLADELGIEIIVGYDKFDSRKIDEMIDKWEKEYHSYFKVDGYFNWINGNNKLKELLQK